ncbi:MAG: SDR family oxidoreductase [Planctomycetaceae bacterium]|jgi:3-oxoacyl-[acyl-carrier protein] reductase|nr:SDR family oxidoreductase [Planctomycetaceae bacterium]
MSGEFEGRVALVTGGSRGIGRATALQLAAGGSDVAISYGSRVGPAEETVADIESLGRRAVAVQCDVSQPAQVDRMVATTRDVLGPISLMAHCGAISNTADHSEMDYDRFKETIDVNLNGAFLATFAVKDEMIQQGDGRIVLVSSIAALAARKMQIHYSTAKAGVIAMTRCCSEAFAPHVRVNCVAPGLTETEMAHVLTDEVMQQLIDATPLGRIGQPEELAEVICFLLSDRSSFMTGQTVVASGGRILLP